MTTFLTAAAKTDAAALRQGVDSLDAKERAITKFAAALLLLFLLLAAGCSHKRKHSGTVRAPQKAPPAIPVGTTEEGIASWYGAPYHGRPAANGEIFDTETLVAAHRTMPFNTWVRVTNLTNGRQVDVRIIDRGPFVRGRIIDVSKAAARQIQLLGPGVARVRVEVIAAPRDVPATDFYGVQIGAFKNQQNAEDLRARMQGEFGAAQIAVKQSSTTLYRVLVGRESTEAGATQLAEKLHGRYPSLFVVRLDAPPKS